MRVLRRIKPENGLFMMLIPFGMMQVQIVMTPCTFRYWKELSLFLKTIQTEMHKELNGFTDIIILQIGI